MIFSGTAQYTPENVVVNPPSYLNSLCARMRVRPSGSWRNHFAIHNLQFHDRGYSIHVHALNKCTVIEKLILTCSKQWKGGLIHFKLQHLPSGICEYCTSD